MSNVIKAYTIRYPEEKRKVDLNEEADRRISEYIRKFYKTEQPQEPAFVEGLDALYITPEDQLPEEVRIQLGLTGESKAPADEKEMEERFKEEREENRRKIEKETEEILQETREQVSQMFSEAKNEAESMKHQILRDAQESGYQEGKKKGMREGDAVRRALEEEKLKLEADYEKKMVELEPMVADLVIALIRKLTGVLLEDRKEIILYLVEQSLLESEGSGNFLVRVSREDYEVVASRKAELLWKLREGTGLEIVEDPALTKSQCMIETDSRVIDCSLDVQLRNLAVDLKLLAGGRISEAGGGRK